MHRKPSKPARWESLKYFEGGDAFFVALGLVFIAAFGILPAVLLT